MTIDEQIECEQAVLRSVFNFKNDFMNIMKSMMLVELWSISSQVVIMDKKKNVHVVWHDLYVLYDQIQLIMDMHILLKV
jgi:hypothetical protein